MATKVKGDAIKEGSIPLSALSNEVKDKIENAGGGADWNAKADEVGYIENKPFGKLKVNGEIFDVSQNPLIRNIRYFIPYDSSIIVFEPSKKIDYIRVHWVDNDVVWIDETIKIPNDYITSLETIKHVSETPLGSFDLDFEKTESEIRVYLTAQDESFSVRAESILGRIVVETITCLSDEYLPNTVLKTTSQTLSDTDKNQALANLGIDNTKYILSIAPSNTFNIREFIDKFGFIAELNDDGYGGYIGDLIVTNKELFLDKVLCCGFNTSLAKCIYVNNSAEVVFFFEEGLAKGSVKVGFAENDMNSEPTMIGWEPLG